MATIAAHAVATSAAAKTGASGDAAPKSAGGVDALFAALLASSDGDKASAQSAKASATDAAAQMAQLLEGSAQLAAPAAANAKTKTQPGQTVLKGTDTALAAVLDAKTPITLPDDAQPQDSKTRTAAAPDKSAPEKSTAHKPADAADQAEQDTAALLAALAAQPAPQPPAAHTPAAQGKETEGAAAIGAAQPPAKPQAAGPADPAAAQDAAAGTAAANAKPSDGTQPPSQIQGRDGAQAPAGAKIPTQGKTLQEALAALQPDGSHAAAPKDAAAKIAAQAQQQATTAPGKDDKAQADAKTGATTAKPAAAGAKAAQQTAPTAKTAAAAASGAQAAAQSGSDSAHSGSSDTGSQDGKAPAHHSRTDTAAAKPATAPGSSLQAAFQPASNTASAPDPSAAAQNGAAMPAAGTQAAPAHVAASLQVAPQSAAQAGQQPVPLSDLGAIAINIAAQAKDGSKQFNIALHPQDLGHVHVQLSVDHSGAAQAHLSADNPQTLQLLQRDSHQLERALKDAGLNLTGGGLNFSLKSQQQQQNGGGNGARGNARNLSVSAVASAGNAADAATPNYSLAPGSVRLDIRV